MSGKKAAHSSAKQVRPSHRKCPHWFYPYATEKSGTQRRKERSSASACIPHSHWNPTFALRIAQGDNPLDAGSVHPEAYPVVERILKSCRREVKKLIGEGGFLLTLKTEHFTDERLDVPTVRDILKELAGRRTQWRAGPA